MFNIEAMLERTDTFIDSCLDNPTAKAIDVVTKIAGYAFDFGARVAPRQVLARMPDGDAAST